MRHAQEMGVLKTLGYASIVAILGTLPARSDEALLASITECVGRYSAQMEHHWLYADQPSQHIETQRSHLIDILDTLVTPEIATKVLAARINAKMAHASLLTQAAFSSDPRKASWAEKRAIQSLNHCQKFLLAPPEDKPRMAAQDAPKLDRLMNQETWKASQ